jgi:2-dehydro-3-deoxyphosphogluconate aldolase/(4S)-4-hydroxy-2-oxoglutarate aldolase
VIEDIAPERLVAIVRTHDADLAVPLAEAIIGGGIFSIEVALTTPRALETIAELVSRFAHRALVGAGTVRNALDASSAIAAGARFLVSPDFDERVLEKARSAQIPYVPGALTPSEVGKILAAGVDLIKIFPAVRLGPGYVQDLLGPFPQLRAIPTGGIDLSNAAEFLKAGAVALGVGSSLTNGTGRSGLPGVTARAKRLKRLLAQIDGRLRH